MDKLSKVKTLYAYEDGDAITPKMGVVIENGYGLQQYYDPNTGEVSQTRFDEHPAILYPLPWSSKQATYLVPQSGQWYYNNISDNAGILDSNGAVKSAYSSLFAVTTVTQNGMTFPALKIKGNLVDKTKNDYTDKYIYYVGTYRGKQFTCQQLIPVQAAVGDAYNLLVAVEGADGTGAETLSADNDFVKYTAYLQLAGNTISGVSFRWQHYENGAMKDISAMPGVEISGNTMIVRDAAVEGTELFRVAATYNGKTYYKTLEVSDVHDPLYIDEGCNITGDNIQKGETATFNPRVIERETGNDVTESGGWSFQYTIINRKDGSVNTDLTVSSLTYERILAVGGISVRVQANR